MRIYPDCIITVMHGERRMSVLIEKKENVCLFISTATFRIGWIGKTLFKRKIEDGLSHFKAYLNEEGKNLKKLLEA